MDYERLHNETLRNLQEMVSKGKITEATAKGICADFVAESEDERIRKEILTTVKEAEDSLYIVMTPRKKESWVRWLEKQGTPAKLSEEEQNKFAKGVLKSCALSFIDYLDTHKYEGKMCVSNGECEDIENAFQNAMWDRLHRYYCKYIEKQGEQKPVVPIFREGDTIIAKPNLGLECTPFTIDKIEDDAYWDGNNSILICYQDDFELAEQKSEWSEEDKNIVCFLINITEDYRIRNGFSSVLEQGNKAIDWLKFLKYRILSQSKQEWNEEDDKMINSIAVHLNATTCGFPEDRAWADRFMNWLKSIKDRIQPQSHWMPSDEQMKLLKELVEDNNQRHFYTLLKSLYDQLKTLKGK